MRKSDRKSLCTNRAACSAALNERRQLLVVANEHEHSTPLRSFDSTVAPTRAAATSTFPQEAKRTENSGAIYLKWSERSTEETKRKRNEKKKDGGCCTTYRFTCVASSTTQRSNRRRNVTRVRAAARHVIPTTRALETTRSIDSITLMPAFRVDDADDDCECCELLLLRRDCDCDCDWSRGRDDERYHIRISEEFIHNKS